MNHEWGPHDPGLALSTGDGLAEQAYQVMRDAIIGRQLPAGSRLSAPDIAQRFHISRSPVREAISRLADEGLAVAEPRRGAVVAHITLDDLVAIYDLREVLEGLACRLAATRVTAEDLVELRLVLNEHAEAVSANDVERRLEADQQFHASIHKVAGNARLGEALARLQGQIRMGMDATRRRPGGLQQARNEHEEIFSALERRDSSEAERAARIHIARVRTELRPTP